MSVTKSGLHPIITNSSGKVMLLQCTKRAWSQPWISNQNSWTFGQFHNVCAKVSSAWWQKAHKAESTILLEYKHRPVGNSLCSILYCNHLSAVSFVVFLILVNILLQWTSIFNVWVHFSRHWNLMILNKARVKYTLHHLLTGISKYTLLVLASLIWPSWLTGRWDPIIYLSSYFFQCGKPCSSWTVLGGCMLTSPNTQTLSLKLSIPPLLQVALPHSQHL